MKVYRVEHEEHGDGPYTGRHHLDGETCLQVDEICHDSRWGLDKGRHPTPSMDGISSLQFYERCAFESLESLYKWFDAEVIEQLRELGYVIREMYVPLKWVRFGRRQVVFNENYAQPLAKL